MGEKRTDENGAILFITNGLAEAVDARYGTLVKASQRIDNTNYSINSTHQPKNIQQYFKEATRDVGAIIALFQDMHDLAEEKACAHIVDAEASHQSALRPIQANIEETIDLQNKAAAAALGGTALTAVTFGLGALIAGGAIATAVGLEGDLTNYRRQIESLNAALKALLADIDNDKSIMSSYEAKWLFSPTIIACRAAHSSTIFSEIEKYADAHGTNVDAIVEHLDSDIAQSLLALLKAQYTDDDLHTLKKYAATATITQSPEQRAFLQFVNHALVPHQDFFEIWASKMHDLQTLMEDVTKDLNRYHPNERKKLELFGEKPISLSGKRDVSAIRSAIEPTTLGALRAHAYASQRQSDALSLSYALIADVYDPSKGTIRERHDTAQILASRAIQDFNRFFNGIEGALKDIDRQLDKLTAERDKVEFRWERAEGVATQLKLLALRDPDDILFEKVVGDFVGAAAAAAPSQFIGSQVRNAFSYQRMKKEYRTQLESAMARNRLDPAPLKEKLNALDKEVDKLTDNMDFQRFIANPKSTQDARAIFMLLPRIIAGENNIDAMEVRTSKVGYQTIDEFLGDLRTQKNPRLAEAMQHFLFGLANSNDLKVIIAESNRIDTPRGRAEAVLVNYVETVVKRHHPDQSRQASIVDCLTMRNVIPTSKPFHSFGEVVKLETDAALRALLGGTDDFNLVGSNDVHDIFSYYIARHSDGSLFVDPHDKTRMEAQYVRSAAPEDLAIQRDQALRLRSMDTKIPRNSRIFLEMCMHEYLLGQGFNTVKNRSLNNAPQALGAVEMANSVILDFIGKLALHEARARTIGIKKQAGEKEPPAYLGQQIESLLALSFRDFFSELGAQHAHDRKITDKARKLATAFSGENASLANETYTHFITEDGKNKFGLFLQVYQKNLETYLTNASRENKLALVQQIDAVKDIMQSIQIPNDMVLPESEEARLQAHYRNHTLSNVGLNHSTWVARTEAVVNGGKKAIR